MFFVVRRFGVGVGLPVLVLGLPFWVERDIIRSSDHTVAVTLNIDRRMLIKTAPSGRVFIVPLYSWALKT